jgi:hypothetical protein
MHRESEDGRLSGGPRITDDEYHLAATAADYTDYGHQCAAAGLPIRRVSAYLKIRTEGRKRVTQTFKPLEETRDTATLNPTPPNRYALDPDPVVPPRLEGKPHSDDDWNELFDHLERSSAVRDTLSDSTKAVRWHAPVDGPIGVAFFSDLHAGAGGVLYQRFRADMDVLARTDGLYGVMNGDAFENTKPQSKSGTALYSAVFANPREQLEYVKRRALLARGKWVVWTSGNHDNWDYRHAGIDRLPDLCRELDVPYATEAGASVRLTVGVQPYTVIVKHDYAGKSRISKSNSARRLWDEYPYEWTNADVIALAHLHEPDIHETRRKGEPVVYLRSGSYKVADGWAEAAGFKPAYGVPICIFYPAEKRVLPSQDFATGVRILTAERHAWRNR